MSRTLLLVIAVFFFLLAKNSDAQPDLSVAKAETAVPAGLKAPLVGGSEEVEVKAKQGMMAPSGRCTCPLPSLHCGGCQRMRCLMICGPGLWRICQYCTPCEAQTAGFNPGLNCWNV